MADEKEQAEAFLKRLKEIVETIGGAQKAAQLTGLSDVQIYRYLRGEAMISLDRADALARTAGVSLDWLADGVGNKRLIAPKPGSPGVLNILSRSFCLPATVQGESPVLFSEAWLREVLRVDPSNLLVYHVTSDSMEPAISQGNTVVVDQTSAGPMDGIYLMGTDGTLMLKRVTVETEDCVISCDNPGYGSFRIKKTKWETLEPKGRVVQQMRSM